MKRLLLVLALLGTACGKESSVKPANASTFLHYFNGGNNDVAQAVIETSDKGLLILATTEEYSQSTVYRIKLIKTDAYGNQLWQQFYPDFNSSATVSYKAGGISLLADGSDGIAIAGTKVRNDSSFMMLLVTDKDGKNPQDTIMKSISNVNGTAVTQDENGDFVVLGSIPDVSVQKNMVLSRMTMSGATFDIPWWNTYGSGEISLANKLYLVQQTANNSLLWGGTVNTSATTAARFVKVVADQSNEGGIEANSPLGTPLYTETGNDICRYGGSFVVIGETNEKVDATGNAAVGTDKDIAYKVVAADGTTVLSTHSFPILSPSPGAGQDEAGNSVCATKDGGLLLLGTVNSQGTFGKGGKDYYLIKVKPSPLLLTSGGTLSSGSDAGTTFGGTDWIQTFGSKFDDVGVQVIQASDGGYIVLGTTTLANLKTIMLMKTAQDGTIQ